MTRTPATCPRFASWDDQVVITNTTTGDTLTTALVHTDPNVDGVLTPGASLARQYAFTLPTNADGVGNIQITVTANVNHSALSNRRTSLTNANLRTYANGGNYPSAPTTLTVGGVDFALIPSGTTSSSLGILQTSGSGTSFDIPVNIAGATVLYTLINSTYGVAGDTVGTVEVKGTDGADAIFNLVEGTNIRDHNNDGLQQHDCPRHAVGVIRQRPGSPRHADVRPAGCVRQCPDHRHHPHQQRRHPAGKSVPGGGDRHDLFRPVAARFARQRCGARYRQQRDHDGRFGERTPRSGFGGARPGQRLGCSRRQPDQRSPRRLST